MKKPLKKILTISGALFLFLLLVVIIAALLFFFDKPLVKNISQKYLSSKTGFTVQIGKLDYRLSPLRIKISSLRISQETPAQKLNVFLKNVEAKGEFKKLLKQEKPIFRTIEVDGGDVRFQQKIVEETDYQKIILQVADILGYAKKVTVRESEITAVLLSQQIGLTKTNFELAKAGPENTYTFSIGCENIGLRKNGGGLSFDCGLNSTGTITLSEKASVNGQFLFGSLYVVTAGMKEALNGVSLDVDAEWNMPEKKVSLSRFMINVPELADVSGSLAADFQNGVSALVKSEAYVDNFSSVLARLKPYLPQELQNASVQGKARMEGKYELSRNSQGKKENVEALVQLEPTKIQYKSSGLTVQTELEGRLAISGEPSDLRVSGSVQSRIGRLARDPVQIQSTQLNIQFEAGKSFVAIPHLESTLKGVSLPLGEKSLALAEVRLKGKGKIDLVRKNLILDFLEARVPSLPPLLASAKLDLAPRGKKEVSLKIAAVKLSTLRTMFPSLIPAGLSDWELDAACDLSVEARNSRAGPDEWTFSTLFKMADGKFNDPTFTVAGDALQPLVQVTGKFDLPKNKLSFTGALEISRGESLWKAFYISWDKNPMKAVLSGTLDLSNKRLDDLKWQVAFPSLGEISGQGSAGSGPPLSLNLRASFLLSLGPLYPMLSQSGTPQEGRMNVQGQVEGELGIRKENESLSITGRLKLNDGGIEYNDAGILIRGLNVDLPVHIETRQDANRPADKTFSSSGHFRVAELRTPFAAFQPPELIIHSGMNTYHIDPFSISLFGGALEFGRTSLLIDPQTSAFRGLSSLRLIALDISRTPLNTAQFRLSGKVEADFSAVEITPQKVDIQGEGKIDIFGGRATVRNMAVVNPLSKNRTISLNVDLEDIDLKKLTDTVPFGEVTGILRAEIRDLTFSYGQPERFSLKLESVKKKGVAQTFSLKAVDNLTVLSSGQQASVGTGSFWMRYIRGFRYDRIGIVSTLRNDTFTLNGTIKENGVEYLVKKPWLFGINVINREPEKKISFKEMTQRLKRVGQSDKIKK